MPTLWRAALAVWLIAATSAVLAATRFDEAATRDAQRALFSMPATVLEGRGPATPPEGFDGEKADEDDLIAYLVAARRRGADLNALMHLGTPLHHALRSGLDRTAQWLLAHGADPMRLTTEPETARNGRDALELAVAYGRWAVLPALRRHPAVAALAPAEREQRIWAAAQASPGRASELLGRREPLPRFASTQGGGLAQTLLMHSLCSGQLRLAKALLDAETAARPAPPPATSEPLCPRSTVAAPAPLPVAQWVTRWVVLEQRLSWPLLPYALRQANTDAQVRALLAAPLARPWAQPGFARHVVTEALARRLPTRSSALMPLWHAVPPTALQAEVRGQLVEWIAAAADWPLDELVWALAQAEPAALTAAMDVVASRWDSGSTLAGRTATNPGERDERWRLLTRRLSGAPPATVSPLFLYGVPAAVWPRWFELGFRVADDDWANWQLWAPLVELRAAWPRVAPQHPTIAQRSLTWLLAPLSAGPISDEVAARLSYDGSRCCWHDNIEKARFLAAQGLQVQPLRPLAAALRPAGAGAAAGQPGDPAEEEGVRAALQAGWVLPPLAAARLALAPLRCQPRLTAALRRALAAPVRVGELADANLADPATLQWIDAPQGEECIYFVHNGGGGGRIVIDDESFEGGVNRLTPCPDNARRTLVWRPRAQAWAELGWSDQGEVSQVRLPGGGVGLVQHEMDFGTCGSQAGRALRLERAADGDGWRWQPAPGTDGLAQWLAQHCNVKDLSESCLDETAEVASAASPATGGGPGEVPLVRLLAGEKAAFLAAVDTLDRRALASALRDGVFPHWVRAAVERVSRATAMPLADKRRRMAWLLARHHALPGLDSAVLDSLVAWLPAQDWAPLQRFRLCVVGPSSESYPDRPADRLADLARASGRAGLEARLRAGAGRRCGSWPISAS